MCFAAELRLVPDTARAVPSMARWAGIASPAMMVPAGGGATGSGDQHRGDPTGMGTLARLLALFGWPASRC